MFGSLHIINIMYAEYGQEQEVNIVFQSSDTGSDAASVEQESLLFVSSLIICVFNVHY